MLPDQSTKTIIQTTVRHTAFNSLLFTTIAETNVQYNSNQSMFVDRWHRKPRRCEKRFDPCHMIYVYTSISSGLCSETLQSLPTSPLTGHRDSCQWIIEPLLSHLLQCLYRGTCNETHANPCAASVVAPRPLLYGHVPQLSHAFRKEDAKSHA